MPDILSAGSESVSGPESGSVTVRERRALAVLHLSLRAGGGTGGAGGAPKKILGAVGGVFGLLPPETPGLSSEHGPRAAVPLAPGKWLLTAADTAGEGETEALIEALSAAAGAGIAVNDLSSAYAVFRIGGAQSRDVLAKSCPVDLHSRAFGPNACASTVMAHVAVTIRRIGDGDEFDVFTARGFTRHLHEWLTHAAAEYGHQAPAPGASGG